MGLGIWKTDPGGVLADFRPRRGQRGSRGEGAVVHCLWHGGWTSQPGLPKSLQPLSGSQGGRREGEMEGQGSGAAGLGWPE